MHEDQRDHRGDRRLKSPRSRHGRGKVLSTVVEKASRITPDIFVGSNLTPTHRVRV